METRDTETVKSGGACYSPVGVICDFLFFAMVKVAYHNPREHDTVSRGMFPSEGSDTNATQRRCVNGSLNRHPMHIKCTQDQEACNAPSGGDWCCWYKVGYTQLQLLHILKAKL